MGSASHASTHVRSGVAPMCDPENFMAQEREEQRAARWLDLPAEIDRPSRAEAEADERECGDER